MIHVCTMNMYVHILYNYVSVCVGMCVFFVIQLERERETCLNFHNVYIISLYMSVICIFFLSTRHV